MCSPVLLCGHRLQLDQAFERVERQKHSLLFPVFQWASPSWVCAYSHSSRSLGLCFLVLLQISGLWHGCFRSGSYKLLRNQAGIWTTQCGSRLLPFGILLLSAASIFLRLTLVVSQAGKSLSSSLRATAFPWRDCLDDTWFRVNTVEMETIKPTSPFF